MKVGLVCPYNILRGGGVQECVLALQAGLTKLGHQAKIITPTPPRTFTRTDDPSIIYVGGATEVKSPFATSAEISVSANTEDLKHLVDVEKFDILHFHEPWVPILSRQLLTRSSSINIATFHAKLPETIFSRTIERVITPYTKNILKHFQALTAVSEAAAEYVSNLSDQEIEIIPNGINLNKYQPPQKRLSSGNKRILFVGRLEKRKGVKYLIQAYAKLRNKRDDIELIIAGDGADRKKLEQFVADKNLPGIQFLGSVSEDKKLELLQTCSLFCSPALYGESFGIVLLEAMATGIVTIAGDNPGYKSVMKDKGAISLVNPKKTDEFARRMAFLLDDSEIRKIWQQWAKTYIKQFSYDTIVGQYEKTYKRFLK